MEPVSIEVGGTDGTEVGTMEVGGKIPVGVGKRHHREEEDGDTETAVGKAGKAEDGNLPLKARCTPESEECDVQHPTTKAAVRAETNFQPSSAKTNADDDRVLTSSEICPHASDDARVS